MNNVLWICVVSYAFLPIYGQQKATQSLAGKNPPGSVEQIATPTTATVLKQHAPNKEQEQPKEEARNYLSTLFSPINLPNDLLVLVGIGAIVFAAKTVGATRDAAKAAVSQANHMVASERAWLIVSSAVKSNSVLRTGYSPYYYWQVKNLGKTPARLIATQAHCRVGGSQLPEEPVFHHQAVELHERILAPGDVLEFCSFWENHDGARFRDTAGSLGSIYLKAYGYIKYRTVFSPDIREARFCDYFNHDFNDSVFSDERFFDINFRPDLTAPAAYTKHT